MNFNNLRNYKIKESNKKLFILKIFFLTILIFSEAVFLISYFHIIQNISLNSSVNISHNKLPKDSNPSNSTTLSKDIDTLDFKSNLTIKPDFSSIKETIEDDDTTWALLMSGLVKYDKTSNQIKIYTIEDGLKGGTMGNMIKRDNEIWIATSYGINKLEIDSEKITYYSKKNINKSSTWDDMFHRDEFTVKEGLSSNGNLKVLIDPYTKDIWTESFVGISKFEDDKNEWISYGMTDDKHEIGGSQTIVFSKDYVITFDGSNAYTSGGVYTYDRDNKKWLWLSNDEKYDIQNGSANLISSPDKFWVYARPLNYASCGDGKKEKASRILGYSKKMGWDGEEILNNEIKLGEEIIKAEFKDKSLSIFLLNPCNANSNNARMFKYDPQEKIIIERKAIDSWKEYINQDKEEKDMNDKKSSLIKKMGELLNESPKKNIIISSENKLLVDSGDEYAQFDENFNNDQLENKHWENIREKESEFFSAHGISKDENTRLEPLKCNQLGDNKYIYLDAKWKISNGMGINSGIELIVKYNKENSELILLKKIDYAKEDLTKNNKPFYCDDDHYLLFSIGEGAYNHDFKTGKNIFLDKENFQEKENNNKYNYEDNFNRNNEDNKFYFPANNNKLGIFDPKKLKYEYIKLSDNMSVDLDLNPREINFLDTNGEIYLFSSNNIKQQGYLFIFHDSAKKWDKIKSFQESRGTISKAKIFKNLIWIFTNEGMFNNICYILDVNTMKLKRMSYNNGVTNIGLNKIVSTSNKLFLSGDYGLLIFK
jgi:hypothetical protein